MIMADFHHPRREPRDSVCNNLAYREANVNDLSEIDLLIEASELELIELDARRAEIMERLDALKMKREHLGHKAASPIADAPSMTSLSDSFEKITLFRSLFRGREDVFPKRFKSVKTGKNVYSPCCRNEWSRGICGKPETRCAECGASDFIPVTDKVIKSHLLGYDLSGESKGDFSVGVYVSTLDETCWFLAMNFDQDAWREDAAAYMETCKAFNLPAALERSGSGIGGHVWIFFQEPVPAEMAGKLGAFLLTETVERRPEVELNVYDRFFPNRDAMPKGEFGSFIALPFQKTPGETGCGVFLDDHFLPHEDQWTFLSTIQRAPLSRVQKIAARAVSC